MEKIKFSNLCKPTKKQKLAFKIVKKKKYFLYGGAMGGGKSYFLRWCLLKFLLYYAQKYNKEGVRVGLFCEDYPSLKDRHISKIEWEFPKWLGYFNKADHEYILNPSFGSGVLCFRNLDDTSKYQSSEFAAQGVDELTKNTEETFNFLRTRLRWSGIKDVKFIAGINPGGIGHTWVKKKWIDREFESTEKEADQFYFLPAKVDDNPHLDDSYKDSLLGLPEKQRKAYLEGNWDIFEGQYFGEWDGNKHIITPFPIPDSWMKYRAYDHGKSNPACMKWYAVDYDGNVWVYRELYLTGKDVPEIAKEIIELSGKEQYYFSVADPSIFSSTGMIDRTGGETIAQAFANRGVVFHPASNRRVDGWSLMHQYLAHTKDSQPKLRYFSTCFNSIKTIPALIHDEIRPEDLNTKGEDHCADTDRYFLMMFHESKSPKPLNEVEKKLKQMRRKELETNLNDLYSGRVYRGEV